MVSWESYKLQFDMLAELNHWSEQDKATHSAISLRGSATGVLTSMQPEKGRDYSALVAALDLRFCMAHQTELNRAKLKNRTRKQDETLQELAEDVEKLTRLSYPDAPMAMLDILSKDQFLDALQDNLRLRIRQHRPTSLHRALETVLELEAIELANNQRQIVREVTLEEGESLTVLVRRAMETPFRDKNTLRSITCWKCGRKGHLRRDCRQKSPVSKDSGDGL